MKNALYLFALIALSGCYKPAALYWEDMCVDRGQHRYQPYHLNLNDDRVEYLWELTPASKYDLIDEDQQDWNKLTGQSFKLLNSAECSLMAAWRYNIEEDVFELSPYMNLDGEKYNVDTGDPAGFPMWGGYIIKVKADEQFRTRIKVNEFGQAQLDVITDDMGLLFRWDFGEVAQGTMREIYPWFGGNEKAPLPMCMRRMLIQ